MTKKELDLSRRKLLAGLGTAGVAAAGAGLGTTAYLNDTESFTDNQMVAGTLDLKIDWQQTYYGPDGLVPVNAYPDHDGNGLQSTEDGDEYVLSESGQENEPIFLSCGDLESGDMLPAGVYAAPNRSADYGGSIDEQGSLVSLDDVKPGDWGEITFSIHLCDNPGYLWLTADGFDEGSYSTTEPEEAALGPEESDDGELAENIWVEIWHDDNCDNSWDEGEAVILGEGDGEHDGPVSLAEAMDIIERNDGQVPLDADGDAGWDAGPTSEDRTCFDAGTQHCIGVRWWVPEEVGNVIQDDWVEFDLGFYAEQCRHNDGAGMES